MPQVKIHIIMEIDTELLESQKSRILQQLDSSATQSQQDDYNGILGILDAISDACEDLAPVPSQD